MKNNERTIPAKKIAVFRALKVGDMLCSVPALRALRQNFPHAEITLISLPWAQEFANRFPQYIDSFIAFPGFPGLPEQEFDQEKFDVFLCQLQEKAFDLFIQMHGSGAVSNSILPYITARERAGFYDAIKFKQPSSLFIPYPEDRHEIERLLRLTSLLGCKEKSTDLEFRVLPSDMKRLLELKQSHLFLHPYVVIHPGAISSERYPETEFAHIADYLAELGFDIVLTGTENEKYIVQSVINDMKYPAINLAGKTDLGTLAALLTDAMLLVSNDTGISHLAVATQTPSVVLFSSSDPLRWAPLDTKRHLVLTKEDTKHLEIVKAGVELMLKRYGLGEGVKLNTSSEL